MKQVRAKSVVLLEIGECGAGGQSTILENIQSEFDKHTGRVSIVLCNNQLLDPFKSITEGLEGAGRPFAVVYVGQPEQVNFHKFPLMRTPGPDFEGLVEEVETGLSLYVSLDLPLNP